jgi:phosphoglycerate dehydrogenase-like enzyme
LAWLPRAPGRETFVPPDGWEARPIPRDPARDPDLGRVAAVVPQYGWRPLLEALPLLTGLQLIQTLESGVDWLLPFVPDGVTVCNARGAHDSAVSEWVLAAILAMQRRLPEYRDLQGAASWRQLMCGDDWGDPGPAVDLDGARALIVGYGSIGAAVERRLEPFGVEVARVSSRERRGISGPDALPGLMGRADVVVVLVPLSPETEGMIGRDLIARMRPGALLVNAARGRVVDRDALFEALSERRIRAALDVTHPEPLPADDPLWSAPGTLITPHVAGDTPRRMARSWGLLAEQLGRLDRGEPPVNRLRPA